MKFFYRLTQIAVWFFVNFNISDNLKEWMLYADIVLLSTWFDYGVKTLYDGGTLGIGY